MLQSVLQVLLLPRFENGRAQMAHGFVIGDPTAPSWRRRLSSFEQTTLHVCPLPH